MPLKRRYTSRVVIKSDSRTLLIIRPMQNSLIEFYLEFACEFELNFIWNFVCEMFLRSLHNDNVMIKTSRILEEDND